MERNWFYISALDTMIDLNWVYAIQWNRKTKGTAMLTRLYCSTGVAADSENGEIHNDIWDLVLDADRKKLADRFGTEGLPIKVKFSSG